eukprot:Awhi_evm2s8888
MMKSTFPILAVVAAVVPDQEAAIGGERPDDVPRSFNQILGDFEPEDFRFDLDWYLLNQWALKV